MADLNIKVILSDSDQTEFLNTFPNIETILDSEWVDPKDGSSAPLILKYSDEEWVIEKVGYLINKPLDRTKFKTAQNQISIVATNVSVSKINIAP